MPTLKLLLAAVSVFLCCSCMGDSFNRYHDDPASSAAEPPPSRFPQCQLNEYEKVDYQLLAEAEFKHQPAPGLTVEEEIPVSPKGCIRYFQRIEDGVLVSQGLVMATGWVEMFVEVDGTLRYADHQRYLSREDFTPTSSRLEIDSNADGFVEALMMSSFDDLGR
jgi:hypothetical protein